MAAAAHQWPLAWSAAATTWFVVWAILAVATAAIVVLVRTRWRDVKPWKKCALLSAWVHVLLACLATNIRIGAGGAGLGPGEGGPMRVAIISVDVQALTSSASTAERAPEEVALPPLVAAAEPTSDVEPAAPAADELVADAPTASDDAEPEPALAAPDLLPTPAPPPELKTDGDSVALEPAAEAVPADDDRANAIADVEEQNQATATAEPAAATASPTMTDDQPAAAASSVRSVPAPYAKRFANRETLTGGGGGGNADTERAVRAALAWLASAQSDDGRWDARKFGAGQERFAVLGQSRGSAGAKADTGVTALALLAFLGSGHTHLDGPYADQVARGLDYLRRRQAANGNLGGDAELFAHMYCHSMATFAVSEACAMTGDEKLRAVAQRAVAYSLAAQHPSDGGWRYRPGDTGDTSQLGWQLMALKSAELAGVDVPPVTWTRVERFLRNVERGAAGGLAAYRPEGPPSRSMTAEALFCRQLLTRRSDGGLSAAARDEARRALLQETPGGPVVNFYYWYYATIALHRARQDSSAAEDAWREWNAALTAALVDAQEADGSWSSACLWGGYGGRVYTTALAAMCLEVYYRYADEEPPDVAQRDQWQSVPTR